MWRLGAIVAYVAGALAIVGPQNLVTAGRAAGKGLDLPGTIWIHWWVRQELFAGRFPVRTDLLFYPDGKNFLADTGGNYVDAILGIPLQLAFGVPEFVGWLGLLILVGNALAGQRLAEVLLEGRSPAAAWATGMLVLLNPFTAQELSEGRPTQALMAFGLLAAPHLLRLGEGWRHAAWLGAWVALQAMTYWFTAYFLALAFLPVALWMAWRAPRIVLPRLALAVAVTLLLTSPFLVAVYQALRDGLVTRTDFGGWRESPAAHPGRWRLVFAQLESGAVLVAVVLAARARAFPALAGAVLATAFAVGARLDLADPPLLNPLYVGAWKVLPLLPRLGFPERAMMGVWTMLAAAGALGLGRLRPRWALLFGVLASGEAIWRNSWPIPGTVYDVPAAVERIRDGGVIHLPFAVADPGMVLQTVHGQPIFGGMGERERDLRPKGLTERLENPFYVMLAATMNDRDPPIAYTLEERTAITTMFRWVWLDRRVTPEGWGARGYEAVAKARALTKELGPAVSSGPDGWLWDLARPIPANPPGLGADAVDPPAGLLDQLGDIDRPILEPEPLRRRGQGPGAPR